MFEVGVGGLSIEGWRSSRAFQADIILVMVLRSLLWSLPALNNYLPIYSLLLAILDADECFCSL